MKYQLIQISGYLALQLLGDNAPGPVTVNFLEGALAHRRRYGGGHSQLIAKAVGIKSKEKLTVLDATAGLGRDAFVLALLGCDVTMCERSSIIHALLQDGLERARAEKWFADLRLALHNTDAQTWLSQLTENNRPDVIYIDPMFPERTKSALVKKEMRVLREVVGEDLDTAALLESALAYAKKRVVVKRAKLAPTLTARKPDLVYKGKSTRFDVYLVVGEKCLISSSCPSPAGEGTVGSK